MAQLGNGIGAGLPIQSGTPVGWTKQVGNTSLAVVSNTETEYSDRAIQFSSLVSTTDLTWDAGGVQDDSEVLCLFKMTGSVPNGNLGGGPQVRSQDSSDSGYNLNFVGNGSSGTSVRLQRTDGGNATIIGTGIGSWSINTWYWARLRAVGSTISIKLWQVGTSEPGAFQITAVDDTYPTGRFGIRARQNSFLPLVSAFWAATDGDTATRGNTLNATASLALSSTFNPLVAGVRFKTNKAQIDISSVLNGRFVAKPINITAVLAAGAIFNPHEWVPTRWAGEAILGGQSKLSAKAFIPYKTIPKHYEGDRYHRRFADDYWGAFNDLLPTGLAWPREPERIMQKVVSGLSAIWGSCVEQLAELLLVRESDPRTTVILLPDWERAFGLPDKCLAEPQTIYDRQVALVHKMTMIGAQSREFFIEQAARIGYRIDIREWAPFMAGISMCGDTRNINAFENVFTTPGFTVDAGFIQLKYDFETNNSILNWTGSAATLTNSNSGMTVAATGADPVIRSPNNLIIEGDIQRFIVIDVERTAIRSQGAWQGQIYYTTTEHGESEQFTYKFSEIDNGNTGGDSRVKIIADMWDLVFGDDDWRGSTISQIRVDFEDGQVGPVTPNGQFKIHSITVRSDTVDDTSKTTSIIVREDTEDNYRWEIGKPEMRFFWSVKVGATKFTWFRASSGQAGVNHHLEFALATDLECLLRRWKPAHTEIIFDYSPLVALDFSKGFDVSYYLLMT